MKVIAVIACYKTSKYAPLVVINTLPYVDKIICVDDGCPEKTGLKIKSLVNDERVIFKYHKSNRGVGAAMKTGIYAALEMSPDIIIKIDSDGQMDPKLNQKGIQKSMCFASVFRCLWKHWRICGGSCEFRQPIPLGAILS